MSRLQEVHVKCLSAPQVQYCDQQHSRLRVRVRSREGSFLVSCGGQFDYSNLDVLIAALGGTNALEESPAQFRLLNVDGSTEA